MPEPFQFANNQVDNIEYLLELCQQSPDEAINYLIRQDFEKWLAYIGKNDYANLAQKARQASVSNEEKLQQFILNCQEVNTNIVKKQLEQATKSANLPSKIIQALKNFLFGNRQKTQERKLSTE